MCHVKLSLELLQLSPPSLIIAFVYSSVGFTTFSYTLSTPKIIAQDLFCVSQFHFQIAPNSARQCSLLYYLLITNHSDFSVTCFLITFLVKHQPLLCFIIYVLFYVHASLLMQNQPTSPMYIHKLAFFPGSILFFTENAPIASSFQEKHNRPCSLFPWN